MPKRTQREHPILRYCRKHGITQTEFGNRVGLSPQFITDLIKGRSGMSRPNMIAVVSATGGQITLEELVTWEPRGRRVA